jgi:protein-tyrosine phosphatase
LAGKDRTGLVSAILLRLAGVDHATIGADYALTAGNLRERWEAWLQEAPDEERAKLEKLQHTPADAMARVVQEIERRYGDVASYLRAAGLTDAQVERLRERLVAP